MTSLRWIVLLAVLAGQPALADPEHTATNPHRLSVGEYERNLPLIFLEAKEPALSEQKVACSLRILCPEGSEGRDSGPLPGGIQLHGGMSRSLPKKSFSIRLQHPAQLLDLREHAHWILNAACIDRSLMRHKLSFDLFRSLSAQGVNRCAAASRFVEVYFDGKVNHCKASTVTVH